MSLSHPPQPLHAALLTLLLLPLLLLLAVLPLPSLGAAPLSNPARCTRQTFASLTSEYSGLDHLLLTSGAFTPPTPSPLYGLAVQLDTTTMYPCSSAHLRLALYAYAAALPSTTQTLVDMTADVLVPASFGKGVVYLPTLRAGAVALLTNITYVVAAVSDSDYIQIYGSANQDPASPVIPYNYSANGYTLPSTYVSTTHTEDFALDVVNCTIPVPTFPALPAYCTAVGGSVLGDPQFTGLRGQTFQVHGVSGSVYNLISEAALQVNAQFVFLASGRCPDVPGMPSLNCWSHPGTYLGQVSFQVAVHAKIHTVLLVAGPASTGFTAVLVNGKNVTAGVSVEYQDLFVAVTGTHTVTVRTKNFAVDLNNSDRFINQALRSRVPLSHLHSHGLIGQTHSSRTYKTGLKVVEGDVDDYVIEDGDMFGTAFVFNRFRGKMMSPIRK